MKVRTQDKMDLHELRKEADNIICQNILNKPGGRGLEEDKGIEDDDDDKTAKSSLILTVYYCLFTIRHNY